MSDNVIDPPLHVKYKPDLDHEYTRALHVKCGIEARYDIAEELRRFVMAYRSIFKLSAEYQDALFCNPYEPLPEEHLREFEMTQYRLIAIEDALREFQYDAVFRQRHHRPTYKPERLKLQFDAFLELVREHPMNPTFLSNLEAILKKAENIGLFSELYYSPGAHRQSGILDVDAKEISSSPVLKIQGPAARMVDIKLPPTRSH